VFRVRKLLVILFFALSFALLLTACGRDPQPSLSIPAPSPVPEVVEDSDTTASEWAVPIRGEWAGSTYANPSLGLRFTLPRGWMAASDSEIADMMGFMGDFFDLLPDNIWDRLDILLLIDMVAMDPLTGANINILLERLVFPNTRISEAMYIERMAMQLDSMGSTIIFDVPSPVRLGDYDWYSFGSESATSDAVSRGFITIQNGFARIITITYDGDPETLEEVLSMFEGYRLAEV